LALAAHPRENAHAGGESYVMNAPVNEGDILAGKYRVERVLGVGGMGVVVAATHIALQERVALKFLLPELLTHAETVGRFLREAQAAVKIKSEHVARVSDVGTLENGAPYMVMEYLEGSDLSDVLKQNGPLGVQVAVDFLLQACEAIAEAHSLGIVHRDLKPANLFLTTRADGTHSVKVLDFGISKLTGSMGASGGMTKTTAIMGSPYYMSPEQLRSSRSVDHRTDIWALGIILYELLTGDVAYKADTMPELCVAILEQPPPAIRHLRGDVAPELEFALQTALQKDLDKRFANIAELAVAIAPFGGRDAHLSAERIVRVAGARGVSLPRPSLTSGAAFTPNNVPGQITGHITGGNQTGAVSAKSGTNTSWGATGGAAPPAPKRVNPAIFAVIGGLVVALAGGGIFLATRGSTTSAAASPVVVSATPPTDVVPTPTAGATEPTVAPVVAASAPPAVAVASAKPPEPPVKVAGVAAPPKTKQAAPPPAAAPPPKPKAAGGEFGDRK
jgi:eukaryotic-like serine/threonine-protein kinase